jgi:hypothetical protein
MARIIGPGEDGLTQYAAALASAQVDRFKRYYAQKDLNMIGEAAEINVLFNNASQLGVRFHQVPRALLDLIPGDENQIDMGNRRVWIKHMLLTGAPGHHVEFTMYCNEPPLREPEPIVNAGEQSNG